MKIVKQAVKRSIGWSVDLMARSKVGRYLYEQIVRQSMGRTARVNHRGMDLLFAVPNMISRYRAETFSSKEPETLEWIDAIPEGSVLWDIGANVGLYSCYAAKQRGCKVFAFEPSVFNLELLARNIFTNGLVDFITIVSLPLCDALAINKLNMTTTDWGGAMSSFGVEYGHDGKPLVNVSIPQAEALLAAGEGHGHLKVFEFSTIGLSMDETVEFLGIPQPDYIKMDVDGIEHLILKGGEKTLRQAKGILIEINDNFSAQAKDASAYLQQAGFSFKEKKHAETYNAGKAMHTFNQIWVK